MSTIGASFETRPTAAPPAITAKPLRRDEGRVRGKSDVARAKGVTTMPEITISMAAGRTEEQKVGMMRDITQALVKNLGVDADNVVIQINEAPLTHKMKGGKTFVERAGAAKK